MTVLEIVEKHLRDNGFDGLYSDRECACLLGDLEPCGEVRSCCSAGYRVDGCDPDCGQGCGFHVVSKKPPPAGGEGES